MFSAIICHMAELPTGVPRIYNAPSWRFDLQNMDSLRNPKTRAGIPDLKKCLDIWLETGNMDLFRGRVDLMPRSHLAPVFVMNTYGYVHEVPQPDGTPKPFLIVNHEPGFSAGDNAEALLGQMDLICQALGVDKLPQVLKTVTLRFANNQIVLVSGIGDSKIDRDVRMAIGEELGLPRSESRSSTINPSNFDTTIYLGLQPGMVKPILEPHLAGNVSGICYLKNRIKPEDFVAISVSHIDSMIIQVRDFEFLFEDYARDRYPGFEFINREAYDFYKRESIEFT